MYFVYQIKVLDKIRYIGYTENLIKREKQHNYLCFKRDKKKELYDNIKKTNQVKINLEVIKSFNNKVEAKRYECLLILEDYFTNKELWQQVPKISDMR